MPERVQAGPDLGEESSRFLVQRIGKARRADQDLAVARVLAVQDAQRVALESVAAVLGQVVAVARQIADQLIAIGLPARRIAQAVQLQHDLPGEAELGQNSRAERDHLDIGERL